VERLATESYKKRRIVVAAALSLIVMCIIIYFRSRVFAEEIDVPSDESLGFSQFAAWVAPKIQTLLKGELIQGICDRYFGINVKDIVLQFSLWNPLVTFFKSVGILICFFNMMMKIIKTCEKGEITAEQFVGVFLSLAIPCILIFEYDKLMDAVTKVANYLFDAIKYEQKTITNAEMDEFISSLVLGNDVELSLSTISDWMAGTITGLITWLALAIANFIMGIHIVSSIISLYMNITVRYIFMPVSIANVAEDGPRSSGMKYILKFIAAHVHVASIGVITQILMTTYTLLIAAFNSEGMVIKIWELIFIWLCLPAALKSGINMSGEAIKDAFGVGL